MTEFSLAIVVFFSVGYALLKGSHIRIELFVSKLPLKAQAIISVFSDLLSIILFSLVAWQMVKYASRLMAGRVVSGVLALPLPLFVYLAAFGTLVFVLVNAVLLLKSVREVCQKNDS